MPVDSWYVPYLNEQYNTPKNAIKADCERLAHRRGSRTTGRSVINVGMQSRALECVSLKLYAALIRLDDRWRDLKMTECENQPPYGRLVGPGPWPPFGIGLASRRTLFRATCGTLPGGRSGLGRSGFFRTATQLPPGTRLHRAAQVPADARIAGVHLLPARAATGIKPAMLASMTTRILVGGNIALHDDAQLHRAVCAVSFDGRFRHCGPGPDIVPVEPRPNRLLVFQPRYDCKHDVEPKPLGHVILATI
jgi:hypothetical protein